MSYDDVGTYWPSMVSFLALFRLLVLICCFIAEVLVPPLLHMFRSHHIPTILRTSALSLLSQCISASSLALLPYTVDLREAIVDLLQVESWPTIHNPQQSESTSGEDPQSKATLASQLISTNSKSAPFRRAALHLLTLLLRASTTSVYNSGHQGHQFSRSQARRMKTTLGYIASTDQDNVVRVMAQEALEGIDQLTEAIIGL
jgi:hypothetical protein